MAINCRSIPLSPTFLASMPSTARSFASLQSAHVSLLLTDLNVGKDVLLECITHFYGISHPHNALLHGYLLIVSYVMY